MALFLLALPKADLFIALHDLLTTYPSPQSLKLSLLDYLHAVLVDVLPGDPRAIKLTATRFITLELDIQSPDFVDILRNANEQLMQGVREAWSDDKPSQNDSDRQKRQEEMATVYAQFIDEWAEKDDVDVNLVSPKATLLQTSPAHPFSTAIDSHFIFAPYRKCTSSRPCMASFGNARQRSYPCDHVHLFLRPISG